MQLPSNIDFMGVRKIASVISITLVIVSILALFFNSLQFGLDFTSGTSVRLGYSDTVILGEVNSSLINNGYEDAVVVSFGSDREIRVILPVDESVEVVNQAEQAVEVGETIAALLSAGSSSDITLLGSDYVSAKVGEELAEQGGLGMLVALGIIMVYIAVRFQFKFSVGAVVALAHDVIITLGIFSIFGIEFNLNTLAAMLAIIGYSLNDTIVVSDRLNQTLSRTIITSFTTLLVLFSVLFIGGETTQGFAVALIIGVVIGTYSSIYVASNVILYMNVTREDLMIPVKEGADLDGMP